MGVRVSGTESLGVFLCGMDVETACYPGLSRCSLEWNSCLDARSGQLRSGNRLVMG